MKIKPKTKEFKAVEFMRQQRKKLTKLYQTDPDAFHKELEKATKEFLEQRNKQGKKTMIA